MQGATYLLLLTICLFNLYPFGFIRGIAVSVAYSVRSSKLGAFANAKQGEKGCFCEVQKF